MLYKNLFKSRYPLLKGKDWRSAWHTNSDGNYWIGYVPDDISPKDLFELTLFTLQDLMRNHPELELYRAKAKIDDDAV